MQTVFQKKKTQERKFLRRNEGEVWLDGLSKNAFSYSESSVLSLTQSAVKVTGRLSHGF